jgi:hypothetical protein
MAQGVGVLVRPIGRKVLGDMFVVDVAQKTWRFGAGDVGSG